MLRHVIPHFGESGFDKTTFLCKYISEGVERQCSRDLGLIYNCWGDNTRKSGVIIMMCMLNQNGAYSHELLNC
jgi:hypothetical protein